MANIDYNDLMQSDALVKSNRRFPSPKELSEWFFNTFKSHELFANVGGQFDTEVSDELKIRSKDSDADQLIAYQKGIIRMTSPFPLIVDSLVPASGYSIGLIWSYMNKNAMIKVFRGSNVFACSNMMIMGADDVQTFKFKSMTGISNPRKQELEWKRSIEDMQISMLDTSDIYANELDAHTTDHARFQRNLFETRFQESDIPKLIGDLTIANIELGLVNSYTFNFGINAMCDRSQPIDIYQLNNLKEEGNNRMWNVYNAFTQHLSMHKTELDTKPEKVLGITNLIKLVSGEITADEIKRSRVN